MFAWDTQESRAFTTDYDYLSDSDLDDDDEDDGVAESATTSQLTQTEKVSVHKKKNVLHPDLNRKSNPVTLDLKGKAGEVIPGGTASASESSASGSSAVCIIRALCILRQFTGISIKRNE